MNQSLTESQSQIKNSKQIIDFFLKKFMEISTTNLEEESKIDNTQNGKINQKGRIENENLVYKQSKNVNQENKTEVADISKNIKQKIVAKFKTLKQMTNFYPSKEVLYSNKENKEIQEKALITPQNITPSFVIENHNQVCFNEDQNNQDKKQNSSTQIITRDLLQHEDQKKQKQNIEIVLQKDKKQLALIIKECQKKQSESVEQKPQNQKLTLHQVQTQKNDKNSKKGVVLQEQISYQKQDGNVEIEEVILILDTIKIVSRLTKDLDEDSNSSLVFQLEPMYEIESILEKQTNQSNEGSENQINQLDKSNLTDDKGSNLKLHQISFYRQILPTGCLLTAKYLTSTLPTQLAILFQKVEDMFLSIKNHQNNLFNIELLEQKILLINIPIFQKTKRFKIPLYTSSITKEQFLERKNAQLVDQMKALYKKYKVFKRKYKIVKAQYKKMEYFKLQFQKEFKQQSKNGKNLKSFSSSGLPPIETNHKNRLQPLAQGVQALEQQQQKLLIETNRSQKGKGGMFTRKKVKKSVY